MPARVETTLTLAVEHGQHVVAVPALTVRLTMPGQPVTEVPLGLQPRVIGSGLDCDLVCTDAHVSRHHCQLSLEVGGVLLRDLGSKNGTFVAGLQVREVYLRPGVEVRVGDSSLVVLAAGEGRTTPLSTRSSFGAAVGGSIVMRALFAQLEQAAREDVSLVLWGESGSGKDVLARAVHDHSPRAAGPFVVFDCSSATGPLVSAELFGHEAGAFTGAETSRGGFFEQAHGGTLFLDEIGELSPEVQPVLLRALEERKTRRLGGTVWHDADVRIIAATHRDLRARMNAGTFRRDLFFRLAVVEAWVPALRDRKEDIPLLVERFLAAKQPPRTLADLPARMLEMLEAHDWTGNVRELRNAVERTLLFPDSSLGEPRLNEAKKFTHLPFYEARESNAATFEREYLLEALHRHDGNVSAAARAIGLSRGFLHRLIVRNGLRPKEGS